MFIQLLQRGYANKQIVHAFHLVSNIERESLILYKNKNSINLDFSKNLFLFHKFNFNISKFNDLIFSSFTENKSKFSILNNFSLKVINRVEKNLNSIFVHNFNLQQNLSFFTKKCNMKCRICNLIFRNSFLKLKLSNISIFLLNNCTCNSKNIIYFIICIKCEIFYIGQSSKSLTERITQHLNHINNFKAFKKYHTKEVAKHFNLLGHDVNHHFRCCVFKDNITDEIKRKSIEMDLVNFLNIHYFKCINIYTNGKVNQLAFT